MESGHDVGLWNLSPELARSKKEARNSHTHMAMARFQLSGCARLVLRRNTAPTLCGSWCGVDHVTKDVTLPTRRSYSKAPGTEFSDHVRQRRRDPEDCYIVTLLISTKLPPDQMRRSGRARVLTAKAQEHVQGTTRTHGEEWEDDDDDAMEGVQMALAHPGGSTRVSDECDTATSVTANIEKTGVKVLAKGPATRKIRRLAQDHNAKTKRLESTVDILTNLTRRLLKEYQDQRQESKDQRQKSGAETEGLTTTIGDLQTQVTELTDAISNPPTNMTGTSPSISYANVAASPPNSIPSNIRTITSLGSTGSQRSVTPYFTIDTSRAMEENPGKTGPGAIRQAIEKEMRTRVGHTQWRCVAVTKDAKNEKRVKVSCRDEDELVCVKEGAEKALPSGCRILRDQLYPVKVDNTNRMGVLDQEGHLLPEILDKLGKENEVKIAKISWLTKKDSMKAYGSMVVYVTKQEDAVKLLNEQYFHVDGESAFTRVFETRPNTQQCYNCQETGQSLLVP